MFEASELLDLPKPAFGMEQPDDPVSYLWPAPKNVSTNPVYVNRPANGYPSFWFQAQCGMSLILFDQGPLGHAGRKPPAFGANMYPDPSLVGLEGPGCEVSHQGSSLDVSAQWAKWAPGLVKALSALIRHHFAHAHGAARPHKLASVSADFIRHVQRGHIPFRQDCQVCLQGRAQVRAHRKVLSPDSWNLSMDLSGPFAISKDEFCEVRYMLVGVLTVTILEKKLRPSEEVVKEEANQEPSLADAVIAEAEPVSPKGEAAQGPMVEGVEHHANVDPEQAEIDAALGAMDDDEFLRREESESVRTRSGGSGPCAGRSQGGSSCVA